MSIWEPPKTPSQNFCSVLKLIFKELLPWVWSFSPFWVLHIALFQSFWGLCPLDPTSCNWQWPASWLHYNIKHVYRSMHWREGVIGGGGGGHTNIVYCKETFNIRGCIRNIIKFYVNSSDHPAINNDRSLITVMLLWVKLFKNQILTPTSSNFGCFNHFCFNSVIQSLVLSKTLIFFEVKHFILGRLWVMRFCSSEMTLEVTCFKKISLKYLWNKLLGCRFVVSHERPFDTEKNAIYCFLIIMISLFVPELWRLFLHF